MSAMVGMVSQPPSMSGMDEFLAIARLLSNPDQIEAVTAGLREAATMAEEASAKAHADIVSAEERIAEAQAATDVADQKMLKAARTQERADADTEALVRSKRAAEEFFKVELVKLEAERASMKATAEANEKVVDAIKSACAAREEAAIAAETEARDKTAAAQNLMESATALRADYEARMEKLRALSS